MAVLHSVEPIFGDGHHNAFTDLLRWRGDHYCAAYHFGRRDDRQMRIVHLLHSNDLLDWPLVAQMFAGGGCGEPALFVQQPGEFSCVVRSLEPDNYSWLGTSSEPYAEWTWTDPGVMIQAPAVLHHGDRWIVAGRSQAQDLSEEALAEAGEHTDGGTHSTSMWSTGGGRARLEFTLPSNGDGSYPGLAHGDDGTVLMSYYSRHQRLPLPPEPTAPADIFLARIGL